MFSSKTTCLFNLLEECIWEPPQCEPPTEIRHRMVMVNGKLPRPKSSPKTKQEITTPNPTAAVVTTKELSRVTVQKVKGKCKSESESKLVYILKISSYRGHVFVRTFPSFFQCKMVHASGFCILLSTLEDIRIENQNQYDMK